jgi:hypothetical protein
MSEAHSTFRGLSRNIQSVNVHDYLLDQNGQDWPSILSDWMGVFTGDFTIWMINRYGDLIVKLQDGSIHMLELGDGSFTQIASDREDFIRKIDEGNNANEWLMIPLVDCCVAAGLVLPPGKCYSYIIPPLLGGEYTVENTGVLDIAVHFSLKAQIYRQTKDLPDGTKVELVISTPPERPT